MRLALACAAAAAAALPVAGAFVAASGRALAAPGRAQALGRARVCPRAQRGPADGQPVMLLAEPRRAERGGTLAAQAAGPLAQARQALLRTTLSIVFFLGALGLARPAPAGATDSLGPALQEPAAQLRHADATDAADAMPWLPTRHGHRLAFAGGGALERAAPDAPGAGALAAPQRPLAFQGLVGELKLGQKLASSTKDFNEWIQFKVYEFLASDGLVKLFGFSVASGILVAVGAWMLRAADGEDAPSWTASLYQSYGILNNVPGADVVGASEKKTLETVINLIWLTGLLTFSILVGLVTSAVENGLENALAGTHRVVAKDHIVMLNWGDKTASMLRQMEAAVEDGTLSKSTPVVILAQRDKVEMDDQVKSICQSSSLTVHTRSGNPASLEDLALTSVGGAKHVMLVAPEVDEEYDANELVLVQTASVQALEAESQPNKKIGKRAKDIKMVVAGFDKDALEAESLPGVTVFPRGEFGRRIIAASTSQPGLGSVYHEIFNQGQGCEIYVRNSDAYPWLKGKKFRDLAAHFPNAVV
jgi:hypothetical protein